MANLAQKDGIYLIRFRLAGKEYKRSLKTGDRDEAKAAEHLVELTLHRLLTGQLTVPNGVDAGDFVVSGGTLVEPQRPVNEAKLPSTRELVAAYLADQGLRNAPSYCTCQQIHLRHLERYLAGRFDAPCDEIVHRDLNQFLQARLGLRSANTVNKERVTLVQLYKWAMSQAYLATSPAATLAPIKGGADRPPFRTCIEIQRLLDRGGLEPAEELDLWECLYLSPREIGRVLQIVRQNAASDVGYLLHAIPAYTGMRRGEVLRLKWIDVDLEDGYIIARSRKQSRKRQETQRRVDLHPELITELQAWRKARPKGQHVISDAKTLQALRVDHANHAFWQPMRGTEWCLDRRKNWYKIGFHTYRHSFASNLAAAGIDQRIIDEWMGHTTEAMRKRYRHLFPQNRRSAIESFSLAVEASAIPNANCRI